MRRYKAGASQTEADNTQHAERSQVQEKLTKYKELSITAEKSSKRNKILMHLHTRKLWSKSCAGHSLQLQTQA